MPDLSLNLLRGEGGGAYSPILGTKRGNHTKTENKARLGLLDHWTQRKTLQNSITPLFYRKPRTEIPPLVAEVSTTRRTHSLSYSIFRFVGSTIAPSGDRGSRSLPGTGASALRWRPWPGDCGSGSQPTAVGGSRPAVDQRRDGRRYPVQLAGHGGPRQSGDVPRRLCLVAS